MNFTLEFIFLIYITLVLVLYGELLTGINFYFFFFLVFYKYFIKQIEYPTHHSIILIIIILLILIRFHSYLF